MASNRGKRAGWVALALMFGVAGPLLAYGFESTPKGQLPGAAFWLGLCAAMLGFLLLCYAIVMRLLVRAGEAWRGEDRKAADPSMPKQEAARPVASGPGWWRE